MSRVFWDSMLFIYLLDDHPELASVAIEKLRRSHHRGDELLTSHLALGEVMAGNSKDEHQQFQVQEKLRAMGFSFVPFDGACSSAFARLRSETRLRAPAAIHLACAAAARTDMFLTGDKQLLARGLYVPGIQFIADFTLPVL
jgi:predicted nucleic acid-binding protein